MTCIILALIFEMYLAVKLQRAHPSKNLDTILVPILKDVEIHPQRIVFPMKLP